MISRFGVGAHAACALEADQPDQPLTHGRRHRLSLRFSGYQSDIRLTASWTESSLMFRAIGTSLPERNRHLLRPITGGDLSGPAVMGNRPIHLFGLRCSSFESL
jgi:hypothetical protein